MLRPSRSEVALGLFILLIALAGCVSTKHGPVLFDAAIERHTPMYAEGWKGSAALHITSVATPFNSIGVTLLVGIVAAARTRALAPLQRVGVPVAALLVGVLGGKALLGRGGPYGTALHSVFGYFPSGHTATAIVCLGTLATWAGELRPTWRRPLQAVVGAWVLLVATSLTYHRFHWPTDVVGGALLGGSILLAVPALERVLPWSREIRDQLRLHPR